MDDSLITLPENLSTTATVSSSQSLRTDTETRSSDLSPVPSPSPSASAAPDDMHPAVAELLTSDQKENSTSKSNASDKQLPEANRLTSQKQASDSEDGTESKSPSGKVMASEKSSSHSKTPTPIKQDSTAAVAGPSQEKKRKLEISEYEMKQAAKKHQKQEEERMKMQVLVSNFSEEQLNRYEMFRRATFPKASIKRLMQNIIGGTVSQNVVIAMSGISKVFVGEVIETALDVMEKWQETGPLRPSHLREAVRLLKAKNLVPTTKSKKIMF